MQRPGGIKQHGALGNNGLDLMPMPEQIPNAMISQACHTWPLLVPQNLVKSTQITWSESGAGKNHKGLLHLAKGFKLYPKDKGNQ